MQKNADLPNGVIIGTQLSVKARLDNVKQMARHPGTCDTVL
jgi:hypothetical protein